MTYYESRHSTLHGRGLFATRAIPKASALFRERPLVCMQTLQNRHESLACAFCFGFLPSPAAVHLNILTGDLDLQGVGEAPESFGVWGCVQNCGEIYCSKECSDQAWSSSHGLLCVGAITEAEAPNHPLFRFKMHAVQTNEIFLLAADVVARLIRRHESPDAAGASFDGFARLPFADFVQKPWWDVAVSAVTTFNPYIEFNRFSSAFMYGQHHAPMP